MDAMLIVDMQVGLLEGKPKYDLHGVIGAHQPASRQGSRSGTAELSSSSIAAASGDDFEPQTPGWHFLPELLHESADIVVQKHLNDPFAGTDLQDRLREIAPDRVLITGWATDLCVDLLPSGQRSRIITMLSWLRMAIR